MVGFRYFVATALISSLAPLALPSTARAACSITYTSTRTVSGGATLAMPDSACITTTSQTGALSTGAGSKLSGTNITVNTTNGIGVSATAGGTIWLNVDPATNAIIAGTSGSITNTNASALSANGNGSTVYVANLSISSAATFNGVVISNSSGSAISSIGSGAKIVGSNLTLTSSSSGTVNARSAPTIYLSTGGSIELTGGTVVATGAWESAVWSRGDNGSASTAPPTPVFKATNVQFLTTGNSSGFGVNTDYGATTTLNGGAIVTGGSSPGTEEGSNAFRLDGGTATANGVAIITQGNRSFGAVAYSGTTNGTMTLSGDTIHTGARVGVNASDAATYGKPLKADGSAASDPNDYASSTASNAIGVYAWNYTTNGNSSTITMTNNVVVTHGTGTGNHGLDADRRGTINSTDQLTVLTLGPTSYGLYAVNGGVIRASGNGNSVSTLGDTSHGVYATTAGSSVTVNNAVMKTQGAGALGALAEANGVVTMVGGTLTTSGANADTLVVRNNARLNATNMTVTASGAASRGLFVTGPSGSTGTATLNQVTLVSPQGVSIAADGGTATITFNNSTAVTNNGFWLNVTTSTASNRTIANVTVDPSVVQGSAVTDALSTSNVSLLEGSLWTMTGNSNVTSLTNNASTITYSAPVGDPTQLASYKTLMANTYIGVGGTLGLNTYLGGDGSPSDRLVINGGTATGTTQFRITSSGGSGLLTTGNGIMVVQALSGAVTGTGAGDQTTFRLSNRVTSGAYEYSLFYGGVGNDADDENWYLRNVYTPPPEPPGCETTNSCVPQPPVPIIRPEVPVSMVIPPLALEYGYAMLDTLHERVGETWLHNSGPVTEERIVWCKDASQNFKCVVRVPVANANGAGKDETKWASSGWARLLGDRGLHQPDNFMRRGPNYDYTFGGIQAGLDIYAREQADGTLDKAGIYVGYGQITSNVKGQLGSKAGTVDMDAYTLAGYWTHHSPQGWYTDAVIQGTWYSADAKSVYGTSLKPDGFGIIGSLEGGYAFKLGSGWTLEPQAQIVYQNVSFDDTHLNDAFVRFDNGDSLRGRVGLRVTKTWNRADQGQEPRLVTAWLRANVWHEFLGKTKTSWGSVDGQNMTPFNTYLGGTWGEIGAGVTAQMTDKINIFATGAYNRSLDNKGREGWDGRLGMTVKW